MKGSFSDGENRPGMLLADLAKLAPDLDRSIIDNELAPRPMLPGLVPAGAAERLCGDLFVRGELTVIAGAGGVAKSTLIAGLAIGCARGEAHVGPVVPKPMTVLSINLEDDAAQVERSYAAAFQALELSSGTTFHSIVHAHGIDTFRGVIRRDMADPIDYVELIESKLQIETGLREALTAMVKKTRCDVLILDPAAALYGGVKMDNAATNLVARDLKAFAKEHDIAVVLVSHVRKASIPGRERGAEDVKFGGELTDTARIVVMVDVVPDSELEKWRRASRGPMPTGPFRKATVVKTNLGPGGARFYFSLEIVEIQCGDGSTDRIPVAREYLAPSTAEPTAFDIYHRIHDRLRGEFVKASSAGGGTNIKRLIEEQLFEGRKWKSIYDEMLGEGFVEEVREKNPSSTSRSKVGRVSPKHSREEIRTLVLRHCEAVAGEDG